MAEAIKSLIFFDMEATGLPKFDGPTKITELSFVACSVDHFITSSRQEVPEIPRVLHKLSFCVNPFKRICEDSTRLTGLDNYKLEHESHLGVRELEMITKFVERLQHPTCLVAHNGNSYDYPLLRKEFRKHNVAIPGNLFCVDSLKIFRKIDKEREQVEVKREDEELAEFIRTELKEIEEAETQYRNLQQECEGDGGERLQDPGERNSYEILDVVDTKMHQRMNETTPKAPKRSTADIPPPRVERRERGSPETPNKSPKGKNNIPKSRKQLFQPEKTEKKKYRLCDIYRRFYGADPEDTHRAESDCYVLLKCALMVAREFLANAQATAKPFVDISTEKLTF